VIHLLDAALGEVIPTSLAAFRASFLDVPESEEDGVDAQGDELDPADRGDDVEGVAEPLL